MILTNPIPSQDFLTNVTQWYNFSNNNYERWGNKGHNGIDIRDQVGNDNPPIVNAVADLPTYVVESQTKDTGLGKRVSTVSWESDDKFYLISYGHMSRIEIPEFGWSNLLDKTRPVKHNEVLGYVGSTGYSTGPHLHFMVKPYIKVDGAWTLEFPDNGNGGGVNPLQYLSISPIMKLFKNKNTPGVYVAVEADHPDRLKWIASQAGRVIPEKNDGTVDWDNLHYDGFVETVDN